MSRSLSLAVLFGGAMSLASGPAAAQGIEITVSTKADSGQKVYYVTIEGQQMKCPARSKSSCRDLLRYSREYPGLLSSKSATRKIYADGVNHSGSEPSSDRNAFDFETAFSAGERPTVVETAYPGDEYDYEYEYDYTDVTR